MHSSVLGIFFISYEIIMENTCTETIDEAALQDYQYMNYRRDMQGLQQINSNRTSSLLVVKIAIFGLGRIGTIHLENLRKNPSMAQIKYCIDESTERMNYVKNKWKLLEPETKFLKPKDEDIVFMDKSIDAVLVCTPTFAHEALVLKSLKAGKAVFCEKPLALDHDGIQRCIEASKKYNKTLLCAFNRRFDPGMRSLKKRVSEGEVGLVQIIKTCSRDSPKPPVDYLKISGGIYHDCAVHDIDYICWVLGEYPVSASSYAFVYFEDIKQLNDFDTVAITMKFPSGAIGIIDLSRKAVYGYDQRVEIFGSSGMVTNGDQRPTGVQLHNGKGTTAVPIFYSFASRYQESYSLEMDHFLRVVLGMEECEVELEAIDAVSKIASACEEAARTGQIVSLKWKLQKTAVKP